MSAHHVAALDAFRACLGIDMDAPQDAVLAELRVMPAQVIVLTIECALGLLAEENDHG